MAITIHIPTALRAFTDGTTEVSVEATKVSEALDQLASLHPTLKKHLFTEQGTVRSFVNVYANEENIRHLDGIETPLKNGDNVMIVPSIAGGKSDGK